MRASEARSIYIMANALRQLTLTVSDPKTGGGEKTDSYAGPDLTGGVSAGDSGSDFISSDGTLKIKNYFLSVAGSRECLQRRFG